MNFIKPIIRTLFHNRWRILIGTLLATLVTMYFTRHMRGAYDVRATLYTGVASGYNLESDKRTDWALVQNSMDNLISIIQAESTLRKVSLHLFVRTLLQGNAKNNSNGITMASYNYTYNHLKNSPHGKEILALIEHQSEDKAVENLLKYMKPTVDNYVYGLFYYNHPYYSFNVLKKVVVQRRLSSDLLDINYTSSDPSIAYNTVTILMEQFVEEYRRIRYGETDKVIAYFKSELIRIGGELRSEEDDLTQYNVDKRIINYLDETKEIAAINKEFELREQDVLFSYSSSKSMLKELERHMDNNVKQVIQNMQFIDKLQEASALTGKISEIESTSSSDQVSNQTLTNNKKQLAIVRKGLSELSNSYIEHKYTKEGASRTNIISQWLDQTLLLEKAKAELKIIHQARQELDGKYLFFAPVGTTIKRKERSIDFIERNYLTMLGSYNEALLRKKNLEMTSATLKILNEPTYPLGANPTGRKKIVMGVSIGSFALLLLLFILIELLDRTLRDATRTKRVTGYNPIAAIPKPSPILHRQYARQHMEAAVKELSNNTLRFFKSKGENDSYVINLLSTTPQSGKSEIGKLLVEKWVSIGLKVRHLSYDVDFDTHSRPYVLAKRVQDFYPSQGEDVLVIEYPPLIENSISSELLSNANINLLVAPADRGWKDIDSLLAQRLKEQVVKAPLFLCLSRAKLGAVEDFTGILPPYSTLRKLIYQLSQLALTEKIKLTKQPNWNNDNDENK